MWHSREGPAVCRAERGLDRLGGAEALNKATLQSVKPSCAACLHRVLVHHLLEHRQPRCVPDMVGTVAGGVAESLAAARVSQYPSDAGGEVVG